MGWVDLATNDLVPVALQLWELSQHADTELARLMPPLMTNLLVSAVPPYLNVTIDVPESVPAGETAVIKVGIENVGDAPAENVSLNFLQERQAGEGVQSDIGTLGPTSKVVKTFFLTFPDQDLIASFHATATANNAPDSSADDFTIVQTNCASGP